ncbi:MAG: glutathione S-transferase family protein, partial [Hyphomicrobiaceae bacterium]|nr:glutathione S-transferase family protein [Hyphomicrobiaceae bacterium]
MADELVLYSNPMSRGRMARWMLEEVSQPYRVEMVEYGPPMKSASYLAVNPMGKVPALKHGEVVVTECGAIIAYLADAFPTAGLAPPVTSSLRAPYYRWLMFAAGPIEASASNKALGVVIPEDKRGMVGYGSSELVQGALEKLFDANKYVLGDTFSAADVYVGGELGWMLQFGMFEKRPSLVRYVADVSGRAAFKRAAALDDALIPKKA